MIEGPSQASGERRLPEPSTLAGFLAPGVVHVLGNALFAIRGNLHLVGGEETCGRELMRMLDLACEQATGTVELLRLVCPGPLDPTERVALGPLLDRLCHVARVPLRDHGISLELSPTLATVSDPVPACATIELIGNLLHRVTTVVPHTFAGSLLIAERDIDDDALELAFRLRPDDARLPFPIPLENVASLPVDHSVPAPTLAVDPDASELRLRLPRNGV